MLGPSGKVLVTGADGFIGRALCAQLEQKSIPYVAAVRRRLNNNTLPAGCKTIIIGDIRYFDRWPAILNNIQAVVHLAAVAHIMPEIKSNPVPDYHAINCRSTLKMAHAAVDAGVKRFIFMSSIKVNGEKTTRPFVENDVPLPLDPYAKSKHLAERSLFDITANTPMDLVVLRPPLVYGPGVKANFKMLINAVRQGMPMPLASIDNQRSFIYVVNLCDAIIKCIEHPAAAGHIFLVSDGEDVSTPELIRRVGRALGRSPRLFSFPVPLLVSLGRLVGRGATVERLISSLSVNISKITQHLDWKPPYSLEQGLKRTVDGQFTRN